MESFRIKLQLHQIEYNQIDFLQQNVCLFFFVKKNSNKIKNEKIYLEKMLNQVNQNNDNEMTTRNNIH